MAEMVSMEGTVVMDCLVQKGKRETREFRDPQGHLDLKVHKNFSENANFMQAFSCIYLSHVIHPSSIKLSSP